LVVGEVEEEEEASERKVEHTAALLRETVERLLRDYPPDLVAEAAREDLLNLRPRLEGALDALAQTERRRELTDRELACRRAFRMLSDNTK
jgi:hypothetical protein